MWYIIHPIATIFFTIAFSVISTVIGFALLDTSHIKDGALYGLIGGAILGVIAALMGLCTWVGELCMVAFGWVGMSTLLGSAILRDDDPFMKACLQGLGTICIALVSIPTILFVKIILFFLSLV